MAKLRVLGAGLLGWLLWLGAAPPVVAAAGTAVRPLTGPVVRGFDPPDQPWLPGHRGVDLLGTVGAEIVSARAGRVVFAGTLAGRGVVVVSHGTLRTTYLPVRALVRVGQQVGAGEVIGRLEAGHGCPGGWCLHWGLKRGDTYLDPLSLLDAGPLRLLPDASSPGVGLLVGLAQPVAGDVGVELRGRQ
jgi:murein DD-endopeptidase MepM/ murein hydrolase activator NlpD